MLWKKASRTKLGSPVGQITKAGYRQLEWGGKLYSVHHIIWAMHTGTWPKLLDHVDGNGINNRLENLREATPSQNAHNARKSRRNTSGFKGVSRHKQTGSWQANIALEGKQYFLGLFDTAKAASEAYDAAAEKMHGEFARTNAMMAEEAASKPYLTGESNVRCWRSPLSIRLGL